MLASIVKMILLVFSFLIPHFPGHSQELNFSLLFEKEELVIQDFKADNLGNFYLLQKDGTELIKLDEKGNKLFHFNEYKYGRISILDISNPLKILLYCSDFQTVLLLDNKLNLLHEISLDEFGFESIDQIALTNDNLIWIYEPFEHLLIKFTEEMQNMGTTSHILSEIGHVPDIIELFERNNQLYILEKNGLVHIFNNYGRFINTLEIRAKSIFPAGGQLFFQDQNGQIQRYDAFLRQAIPVNLDMIISSGDQLFLNAHYLMTYKERNLKVFQVK